MGKMVQVFAFDDVIDAETGAKVEADKTNVPLMFEGKSVVLDLTLANYQKLVAAVGPWVKVGKTPATSGAATPGAKRGRKPDAYYVGMREFAKREGIELEQDSAGKWKYPDRVRAQYEQSLIDTGKPV